MTLLSALGITHEDPPKDNENNNNNTVNDSMTSTEIYDQDTHSFKDQEFADAVQSPAPQAVEQNPLDVGEQALTGESAAAAMNKQPAEIEASENRKVDPSTASTAAWIQSQESQNTTPKRTPSKRVSFIPNEKVLITKEDEMSGAAAGHAFETKSLGPVLTPAKTTASAAGAAGQAFATAAASPTTTIVRSTSRGAGIAASRAAATPLFEAVDNPNRHFVEIPAGAGASAAFAALGHPGSVYSQDVGSTPNAAAKAATLGWNVKPPEKFEHQTAAAAGKAATLGWKVEAPEGYHRETAAAAGKAATLGWKVEAPEGYHHETASAAGKAATLGWNIEAPQALEHHTAAEAGKAAILGWDNTKVPETYVPAKDAASGAAASLGWDQTKIPQTYVPAHDAASGAAASLGWERTKIPQTYQPHAESASGAAASLAHAEQKTVGYQVPALSAQGAGAAATQAHRDARTVEVFEPSDLNRSRSLAAAGAATMLKKSEVAKRESWRVDFTRAASTAHARKPAPAPPSPTAPAVNAERVLAQARLNAKKDLEQRKMEPKSDLVRRASNASDWSFAPSVQEESSYYEGRAGHGPGARGARAALNRQGTQASVMTTGGGGVNSSQAAAAVMRSQTERKNQRLITEEKRREDAKARVASEMEFFRRRMAELEEARTHKRDTVDLGFGKTMTRAEIEAIAARRLRPALNDIDRAAQAARRQKEEDETLKREKKEREVWEREQRAIEKSVGKHQAAVRRSEDRRRANEPVTYTAAPASASASSGSGSGARGEVVAPASPGVQRSTSRRVTPELERVGVSDDQASMKTETTQQHMVKQGVTPGSYFSKKLSWLSKRRREASQTQQQAPAVAAHETIAEEAPATPIVEEGEPEGRVDHVDVDRESAVVEGEAEDMEHERERAVSFSSDSSVASASSYRRLPPREGLRPVRGMDIPEPEGDEKPASVRTLDHESGIIDRQGRPTTGTATASSEDNEEWHEAGEDDLIGLSPPTAAHQKSIPAQTSTSAPHLQAKNLSQTSLQVPKEIGLSAVGGTSPTIERTEDELVKPGMSARMLSDISLQRPTQYATAVESQSSSVPSSQALPLEKGQGQSQQDFTLAESLPTRVTSRHFFSPGAQKGDEDAIVDPETVEPAAEDSEEINRMMGQVNLDREARKLRSSFKEEF
ncbi:hypothetical protein G7K_5514-t2 [Saitoella complicata NRRL Y-17804]|uniref:Eisosome protein 1 n=1 Tax=Saitoella complicata (strain BCRC 22490 / CBS 7301 / JCM 7358 / NBRC 10748 / NRRL Y-17804) TaxID=698492 RepID=A0A0E9NNP0_SAICN|nr:hypothetical protein G7K_5514-t2 [Saitoella complicata NRRL Y-17804]